MYRWVRTGYVAGVLLLSASVTTQADSVKTDKTRPGFSSTATVPLSTDRLARIDGLLQQYVDNQQIAGAVALVLREGVPVYQGVAG